jgi:hypothetical protein
MYEKLRIINVNRIKNADKWARLHTMCKCMFVEEIEDENHTDVP